MSEQPVQQNVVIKDVRPYLRLRRAAEAIDFYIRAFGAEEVLRLTEPGGRIGHAEIRIGPATVYLADEYPEFGIRGPESLGGATSALQLDVDQVDALVERASQAGATIVRPPGDEFYGQRAAVVRDPFGHEWMFAQTIEAVSPEEMQRRFEALLE
ncbi:VOC family protein [Paludibaculum fermentans]|uniref:VOC family protein n=1 Tax=Paludibaculum fermentans TaxID=1473598 RepID=A0A7S7NQ61_PALFE|nr:VOC family protein [Paludibaculum fermentans]QOY87703.1 VOC family protein [Paludibaculum fermentans]